MIESKDLPYNPKFSDNIHNTYITLFVFHVLLLLCDVIPETEYEWILLIVYLKIKTFNLLERKDVTISDIVVRTE